MASTQPNVARENKLASGSLDGSRSPSHSSTTGLLPFLVVIVRPKRRVIKENSVIIKIWASPERGWMIAERKITIENNHMKVYEMAVWFHSPGILHCVFARKAREHARSSRYDQVVIPAIVATLPLRPYVCSVKAVMLMAITAAIASISITKSVSWPLGRSIAATDPFVVVFVRTSLPPLIVKPSPSSSSAEEIDSAERFASQLARPLALESPGMSLYFEVRLEFKPRRIT